MPTTRKRLQIVLTPRLEEALDRLARATGLPVATIARSFLEEAVPTLNELSEVLEAGQAEAVVDRWREMVLRLQGKVQELPVDLRRASEE